MVTTKLRDWLFARQRYQELIPIVFDDDGNPISIPDEHLPVNLPELIDWARANSTRTPSRSRRSDAPPNGPPSISTSATA